MASLHLRIAHDPTVLLSAAADGFLTPMAGGGPFPSPSYLLALRQGGVRDDLLALAARRGVPGWFDPPLCIFAELPAWLGPGEPRPLDPFERLALLGELVRRVGGEVLARLRRPEAYLSALDRLFGELAAEAVAPDGLDAALARCGERDEFAVRRDREIAAIYREYVAELALPRARDGRDPAPARDGRDTLAACAQAVRADPDGLARRLGGRREIRILGLQDLRGGWRALLSALTASPALDVVEVYTSVELDLAALGAKVERLKERGGVAGPLFRASESSPPGTERGVLPRSRSGTAVQHDLFDAPPLPGAPPIVVPRVNLIVAPDAQREVEEVAARVRALVNGGVAPQRIAVVAREARPQLPMAMAALERFGLPVTARVRTRLEEVPVVRALLALLDVAAGGWTRHGLVELADQPYLGVELDAVVINALGYRERIAGLAEWEDSLERLQAEASARDARDAAGEKNGNGHGRPVPPTWRVEKALGQLRRLRERFQGLEAPRPLPAWMDWLNDLLAEDGPSVEGPRPWSIVRSVYRAPAEREDVIRLDLAGLKGLGTVAQGWSRALAHWGGGEELLDVAGFAARLREELDADVALWTGTRQGVQVLEALAGAYRQFEHVFVVGLEAGRFPRQAGRSPLLDAVEREALIAAGLPLDGRAAWDLRERELFRSVVAAASGSPGGNGATSLTVSYSRLDEGGREVAKSSFLEALADVAELDVVEIAASRVRTPGLPLCAPERLADAERVARLERRRQAGHEFSGNGTIEEPALVAWLAEHFGDERVWSPTQLEEFAKCPWAYFCGRVLRLEKREDPDTELDPALRGSILHEALHLFFDGAVKREGGPVLLWEEDLVWAEPALLESLDVALKSAGEEAWLGHPALRPARREELRRTLRRYLQFEVEHTKALHNNRANASRTLRTGVIEHEKDFDDVVLERDGVRFRFRGRIDRVEMGIDDRVEEDVAHYVAAIDYKSSKQSTPGAGDKKAWEEGIVLQVPLYAYALAQLWPGAEVARVEYRTLRSPEIVHPLELVQVDRKAGELVEPQDAAAKLEEALATAARHVASIRAGRFPASPAACSDCAPWCAGRDICRAPEGPREK